MRVYKVVMRNNRHWVSMIPIIGCRRRYQIGKTTRPIRGTKLFAFEDFETAKDYACLNNLGLKEIAIFEAEADVGTGEIKRGWLDDWISSSEVRRRFAVDSPRCSMVFSASLNGQRYGSYTVLSDSIKLLEKVYVTSTDIYLRDNNKIK